MNVVFTRLARMELDDASHYYEMEFAGLGRRFRREVKEASERISRFPEAWTVEREPVRKCLLHSFPYKLLYSIEGDHVLIIAVAHLHRNPEYWVDRHET